MEVRRLLERMRGVPYWEEVFYAERRAGMVVQRFAQTVADPLLRQRHLAEVESAGRQLLALVDRVLDLTTAAPAPPPA